MTLYDFKIAASADDVDGLQALHEIGTGAFQWTLTGGPRPEWSDCEARIRSGDLDWKDVGLPTAAWIIPVMTLAEYALLRSVLVNRRCTIRTYNTTSGSFKNYNAYLTWPFPGPQPGEDGLLRDVRLTFDKLELLPDAT
ncbi:MAG TPA: hypothetical protein PKD09_17840 [Aggregatilinea sp.]|uniref:hypothetical protein n=1 Tax=Aggregatilinea sp. TaxID=2806333 RepID=UPI002BCB6D4A|nr:hypothetical protein [Aggregatilinea sp.]HML23523.1 hypothetical protein [Aggregatilinea sp.]